MGGPADANECVIRLQPVVVNDEPVILVGGELDCLSADEFVRGVGELADATSQPVVLDLTYLSFCDAAGLGAIQHLERRVAPRRLVLRSVQPLVRRVFELTGFDRLVG